MNLSLDLLIISLAFVVNPCESGGQFSRSVPEIWSVQHDHDGSSPFIIHQPGAPIGKNDLRIEQITKTPFSPIGKEDENHKQFKANIDIPLYDLYRSSSSSIHERLAPIGKHGQRMNQISKSYFAPIGKNDLRTERITKTPFSPIGKEGENLKQFKANIGIPPLGKNVPRNNDDRMSIQEYFRSPGR